MKTLEKYYSNELMVITELYSSDLYKSDLETQLEIFSSIDIQPSGRFFNNDDIHQHFKLLPDSQIRYLPKSGSFGCQVHSSNVQYQHHL